MKPPSWRPAALPLAASLVAIPALVWAAAIIGGPLPGPLPLFPPDNWWNVDVSAAPLDPGSAGFIAKIGATRQMHPDFGGVAGGNEIYGIPYVVVDASQPKRAVVFDYSDESDGVNHDTDQSFPFYPIPDEAITQPHYIEGGPPGNADVGGDRHMLLVDRDNRHLYELFALRWTGTRWEAGSGAFFDLTKNDRRPDTWTSADAAGLAVLPGLVRYDEVYGPDEIKHALRVTVPATNGYVYPASHRAGDTAGAPPMGTRLRLKAGKDISGHPAPLQKIFRAMKKHGLIVADNGSAMYVSGMFHPDWDNDILNPAFHSLTTSDFEVVKLGWNPPVNGVNLKVTQLDSADPGDVGLPLTYSLSVSNQHAFRTANGVSLVHTLPGSFSFGSASAGCAFAASRVTCGLGALAAGGQTSVQVSVTPTLPGTFTSTAVVSSTEPEEAPADNSDPEATTVRPPPSLAVNDVSVTEGNTGSVNAVFAVTLSAAFPAPISVSYAVTPLTAQPGDFTPSSGTVVLPAGTTSRPLPVAVASDLVDEGNETFLVSLSNASHGALVDSQGVGTILDDDGPPAISITDATVTEGDTGHTIALLRVSLSGASGQAVKVSYATAGGTAISGRDFLPASGTLAFPPGTTTGELALAVVGDLTREPGEAFTVALKLPENATLADAQAAVAIVDDDELPAVSLGEVWTKEGQAGSHDAVFRVALSAPAPGPVSVLWATADATARAGEDYLPGGGTATIAKGLRAVTFRVTILGDQTDERNEAFLVRLSSPTGARLVDPLAQGVITDDDGPADAYTPIASLPYTATRAGRYRLAGNLDYAPASGAAVTVGVGGVILDLDGRLLRGTAGDATQAFGVLARNKVKVTVENGTVQGFLAGVYLAGPPPYATGQGLVVRTLRAVSNTYAGIWLEGR
ncbi:MAG TPA: Calx-beta domain-containing protein, partial [Vicinamibacteria bacterium]